MKAISLRGASNVSRRFINPIRAFRGTVLLLFVLTLLCTKPSSAVEIRTIALSNWGLTDIPVEAHVNTFDMPQVSGQGLVAFSARLRNGEGGVTAENQSVLFAESEVGNLQLIARQGSQVPNTNYVFDGVDNTSIMTASGNFYFSQRISSAFDPTFRPSTIFQHNPHSGLALRVLAGPADGLTAPTVTSDPTSSLNDYFGANSRGDIAVRLAGAPTDLFLLDSAGTVDHVTSDGAFPLVNSDGILAYRTGERAAREIRTWDPSSGSDSLVAQAGTTAPGTDGATFRFLWDDATAASFRDDGITFVGELRRGGNVTTANDFGIWQAPESGGAVELIMREGDPAPGTESGVNWSGFSSFAVPVTWGRSGGMALRLELSGAGVTADNNLGIWAANDNEFHLVARTGSSAPGTEAGTVFRTFSTAGVTADGRGVFIGFLAGEHVTPSTDRGLWMEDLDGELQLIARTGDSITLPNNEQAIFRDMYFDPLYGVNERGDVALLASVGSDRFGIFSAGIVAVPEPSGLAFATGMICLFVVHAGIRRR